LGIGVSFGVALVEADRWRRAHASRAKHADAAISVAVGSRACPDAWGGAGDLVVRSGGKIELRNVPAEGVARPFRSAQRKTL
jgi:hypothetical protein